MLAQRREPGMVVRVWPHGGCPLLSLVSQEHTTLAPLLPCTSLRNVSQSCAYFLLPGDQHPALQPCRVAFTVLARREEGGTMPASTRVSAHVPTAVAPADVLPEARLLSDRQRGSEGLCVASALSPSGALSFTPTTGPLISPVRGQSVNAVLQRDGRKCQGVKVRGDVEIVPAGSPSFWEYECANEALGITLAPA